MNHQSPAIEDYERTPHYLALGNEPTQTIDLQGLFSSDVGESGVFELSDITSTSLGKLLDALPVRVLLIDRWFCVAFVNQSCKKLSVNYKDMKGLRFTDLLPEPEDSARADTLRTKTITLLERVFSDRRPQRAEAILKIGNHRMWERLHLRSVRLGPDRHIMVVIEDLTAERTHQRIFQKDEKEQRKALLELQERVREVAGDLTEAKLELQMEKDQHEETKRQLRDCLQRTENNKDVSL